MTKSVFDNDGVAHAWARGADDARSNNGNFYSNGRKLYSYGGHFVIGVRCGVGLFAMNSNSYSISTSRHQSAARNAASGTIHYFPNLTEIADTLSYIASLRNDYGKPNKGQTARVRAFLIGCATAIDETAGAWLAEFGGLRRTAWAAIKRERARIDATNKRKADKAKEADAKHKATHFATMSESSWRDVLALSHAKYEETYKRLASSLYAAQRYAKAHGFSDRRLAVLKTRRVQALYVRDNFDLLRSIWKGREGLRNQIETVRSCQRFQRDDWETAGIVSKVSAVKKAIQSLRTLSGLDVPPYGKSANVRPFPQAARVRMWAEADRLAGLLPDLETQLAAHEEAERAARARRAEDERLMREASAAARRELWLSGQSGRYGMTLSDDNGGALIRAVDVTRDGTGAIVGGTLETGHGADVPLTHAIKAFRFVKLIRASNEGTWERNGRTVRVGHYQLDRVDSEGFTAGCHRINWPEIERLAQELGVYGAEPCDAREPSAHAA